jgi:hypothetical protein
MRICHRMVLTEEIAREWDAHGSGFALLWRSAMESKGKVYRVAELPDLEDKINAVAASAGDLKEMVKDLHMIAAAMAVDGVVASRDAKARDLFVGIAAEVKGLGKIAWQHIDETNGDAVQQWLRAGARSDPALRLANS